MIARLWRCLATPLGAQEYAAYFHGNVLPSIEAIDGFLGARVLTRLDSNVVEILVITEWESLDAVRRFAGDDIERAVVEPDALAMLTEADTRVRHYEIANAAMG